MNITLAVDRHLVERARKAAAAMGMSLNLNQAIREYLKQLAGGDDAAQDIRELRELSAGSGGRSGKRQFDRDELHERS